MGPSTPSGYQNIVSLSTASMDDHMPVSAARAWQLRNNLQHLIDMSPQHRINWSSKTGSSGGWQVSGPDVIWSQPFVHTWLNGRLPTGLFIRICGYALADTQAIEARISPLTSAPFDASAPYYWSNDATTSSGTAVTLIEDIYFQSIGRQTASWLPFVTKTSGLYGVVTVAVARLDIRVNPADDGFRLTQVMVREFC